MTTPGGQLTPGDDTTPPAYGVPDGAYVGDAGAPNAISQLSHMTEASAKEAMRTPIGPSFTAQRDGIWGFFNGILSIVQGTVGLIVGAVEAVVDGIKAIFTSIGSLFSAGRRDTAAVDSARVAAENAIVANMSASLDHLDEIQRFGGAYMDYPTFSVFKGELNVRVTPLSATVPLAAGTGWIPPVQPLTHSVLHQYGRDESLTILPKGSGQLELQESGLWIIYFQGAFRQGTAYPNRPVQMWCHVTPADSPWLPVGAPGINAAGDPRPGEQMARHRETGEFQFVSDSLIAGYGRAAAHTRTEQTSMGGGNTLFGMAYAYLETGGWKVNLSDMSFEKFGGAASTFVTATKVNSSTLRQNIDALQSEIATALPGVPVDKLLDETAIANMLAQADAIEVPEVEVPND